MALRDVRITLRDKQTTGGSIPGDALFGEPFVNLYDGVLRFSGVTGGVFETSTQVGVFEVGSSLYNQKIANRLSVNGSFIVSGDTGFISTYAGVSGAGLAGKFLSGTTAGLVLANISDIQGVSTYVQPGTNTYTGGTASLPTVNLVDSPSVNNLLFSGTAIGGAVQATTGKFTSLSATTLSGGTILSGATNLYSIFQQIGTDTQTAVQAGSNITTGGTQLLPIISVVSSPSFNGLLSSGSSQLNTVTAVSISGGTVSGGTFISGGTDLYNIFAQPSKVVNNVNAGTNIVTGGTAISPIINLTASPSFNGLIASGSSQLNTITAVSISGGTVSGGTLFSGSTNLYDIFAQTNSSDITRVQPGVNIYTGGTGNFPIVNIVNSPSFTGTISASGITNTSLTAGRVVYVAAGGELTDEAGFAYDTNINTLGVERAVFGTPGQTGTTVTINGNLLIVGAAVSALTSQLYIEDNTIELNFNPTASTASTSLGAGWSIQDGSGLSGTSVFLDIRGAATGVDNRSFATNLGDIRIRESGTTSSPNGVRVLAEYDILNGGSY